MHHGRPVVQVAAFSQGNTGFCVVIVVRNRGAGIDADRNRRTVGIVRGSQVLLHPALITYLDSAIIIAVNIYHLGGAALERGTVHICHDIQKIILHVTQEALQAVHSMPQVINLALQTVVYAVAVSICRSQDHRQIVVHIL